MTAKCRSSTNSLLTTAMQGIVDMAQPYMLIYKMCISGVFAIAGFER